MAGNRPEERVGRTAIRQSWRRMTFLHWRVDADALAAFLPDELAPDVVDGSAWVSITPFRVERYALLELPAVPVVSSFDETNVRTYVRDPHGRDGLWFFSLDVSSLVNVGGGRLGRIPYYPAAMSVRGTGPVRYRATRLVGGPARHDIAVLPGAPAATDDPVGSLLAGRWRAYVKVGRQLVVVPVEHPPWPLRAAVLLDCHQTLLARAGLSTTAALPDLVRFSDGVDARLGFPRRVPAS